MIIIDASVLKHLVIHSRGTNEQILKNPKSFAHYFLNYILSYKTRFNCSKLNPIVLAVDCRGIFRKEDGQEIGRNYWRQKYYNNDIMLENVGYKGHRKKDEKDEIDWATIEDVFNSILDVLDKHSDIIVVKVPFLEADDVMSICAEYYTLKQNNIDIVAVTHDKDMVQIIKENSKIKLYNPFTNKYITESMTQEEKILFYLSGDASDGIPPVKAKTREKSWKKLLSKKTLKEIFEEEPILRERFKINKKIMDLQVSNLPKKLVEIVNNKLEQNNFNYKELYLIKELKRFNLAEFVESKHLAIDLRYKEFKLEEGRESDSLNTKRKYINNNDFKTSQILKEFKH
jgi:5'-3' exonuclease